MDPHLPVNTPLLSLYFLPPSRGDFNVHLKMVWVENVLRVNNFEKEEAAGKAETDFVNDWEATHKSNPKLTSSETIPLKH